MKATGIVRRIDDLGRVVIPKEIRRTMRIREGDPLEIYTDKDGEVIFKKYSPIGELSHFASQYADTLNKTCTLPVVVLDRDTVIATAGIPRKEIADRRVSEDMERMMEQRGSYIYKNGDQNRMTVAEGKDNCHAGVAVSIIADGDVVGVVAMLIPENGAAPGDAEIKLTQAAATFLGKQMEA